MAEESEPATPAICNTSNGIVERARYFHPEVAFDQGDLPLACTGGLTESRNQNDRRLGMRGLLELVRSLDVGRPEGLLTSLRARHSERGYESGADVLTVLLLRADATSPTWQRDLPAPLRLLRRARNSSRMEAPIFRSAES